MSAYKLRKTGHNEQRILNEKAARQVATLKNFQILNGSKSTKAPAGVTKDFWDAWKANTLPDLGQTFRHLSQIESLRYTEHGDFTNCYRGGF